LDSGKGVPYTVIPGSGGPRWIVPNQPKLFRAAFREWHPYSKSGRIFWAGTRLLARSGGIRFLPGSTQITLPADVGQCLLQATGWSADIAPPVILVGNPSPARKVIVFLAGEDGKLMAVAKFPLAQGAVHAICHEADMLRELEGRFSVPKLMHYSTEAGCSIQTYLPGRLGSRACRDGYLELLLRLVRTGGALPAPGAAIKLIARIQNRPEYSGLEPILEPILELIGMGKADYPAVLVHGDFAPWNIRELRDGHCTLVDWESARWDGLPLHDLCHFFYNQTRLFAPRSSFYSSLGASGCLKAYCDGAEVEIDCVPQLTAAYLAAMLLGHWEAEEREAARFCLAQMEDFVRGC
jgi:hypothetical protein